MSEITFNEEVTAEMLNNICVDLGLTEFSYFKNDMPYAVHQLNQITSDLVTPGVLRTQDKINMGCEVIAIGDKAYVQAGVIVFASGAKIRITEPVEIDVVPGTVIYAFYDSNTGKASLEASETTPAGDYLLLAEVNGEGVIEDKRNSCVAKVLMTADAPNVYVERTALVDDKDGATIDMGYNGFSYISLVKIEVLSKSGVHRDDYSAALNNMQAIQDGEEVTLYGGYSPLRFQQEVYLKREGQRINIRSPRDISVNNYKITIMVL